MDTLFEAINKACGELPEGWMIYIEMENGYGGVRLEYEGEEVKLDYTDLDLTEQVGEALWAAKNRAEKL